jgi:diguanylate cyclase (GGDEF)-like protein
MEEPRIPDDDATRVQELHSYGALDTEANPYFDTISQLARRVAGTEIGIVSLVDSQRQWFKSCVGAPLGQKETPRRVSFCGHTILQRHPLIINDTLEDPRFADNPLVLGEPHLRFYAGFPLITSNGFVVGSLCAISRSPHCLGDEQIDSLSRLASLAVQQLEYNREKGLLTDSLQNLKKEREHLRPSFNQELTALERLISRDQMVQMLELMFGMELGSPFTLLRCCFRDYERVNATLGGTMAEEFMNEAARRVVAAVPEMASVARFADAELVVLLPYEVEESAVQRVAERLIAFAGQIYRNGIQSLSMTVSIGIATSRQNYDTVEAILADTSMAVRMARHTIASSFRFIDADSRFAARESYRLEAAFREAIVNRLLEPHLQPIVDLHNGELVGFEALARWPLEDTYLLPRHFLQLSAETGLTGELDLLIIEKTLAALPLLAQPIPQRKITISLNLSGILLEDLGLRARLLAIIDDMPLPAGWILQVELLEDSFQHFTSSFNQFLHGLEARSVRIVIDDFGTGYSSLARLISLPIQGVKVDREFINQIESVDQSPRTLLRTLLTMLADLGLVVTAEGVETSSQREWLVDNGVTRAQGYLFSKPLTLSEAIECLKHDRSLPPAALSGSLG